MNRFKWLAEWGNCLVKTVSGSLKVISTIALIPYRPYIV